MRTLDGSNARVFRGSSEDAPRSKLDCGKTKTVERTETVKRTEPRLGNGRGGTAGGRGRVEELLHAGQVARRAEVLVP